jgi:hypothetical protein
MKAFILGLLIISCVFAQEFPLELVGEIQIHPDAWSWDIQHLQDPCSFSYCYVTPDSIFIDRDIDNPDVIGFPIPTQTQVDILEVFLAGSVGQHDFVAGVFTDVSSGNSLLLRLSLIDIESGEIVRQGGDILNWFVIDTPDSECIGNLGNFYCRVWPPPPLSPASCVIGGVQWMNCWDPEIVDAARGYSAIIDLQTDNLVTEPIGNIITASPYARFDSIQLACLGEYWYSPLFDGEFSYHYLQRFAEGPLSEDTLCFEEHIGCFLEGTPYVATQMDTDGTQRVINSLNTCFEDQGGNFVQIWTASQGAQFFSATLEPEANEVYLRQFNNSLRVINAANGSTLGNSSPILGALSYVIKQPNRVSELVTYDETTRTARIYRPLLKHILTVGYDSEGSNLVLRWNSYPCESGYSLWFQLPPPLDSPTFLGTTSDTTFTYPLPTERTGFFYVKTEQ